MATYWNTVLSNEFQICDLCLILATQSAIENLEASEPDLPENKGQRLAYRSRWEWTILDLEAVHSAAVSYCATDLVECPKCQDWAQALRDNEDRDSERYWEEVDANDYYDEWDALHARIVATRQFSESDSE